jgi:hypothetical protein
MPQGFAQVLDGYANLLFFVREDGGYVHDLSDLVVMLSKHHIITLVGRSAVAQA